MENTYIILVVIALIALILTYRGYKKKCTDCEKWGAMRERSRRIGATGEKSNSSGDTSLDVIYEVHRKCKHCGYEDDVIRKKGEWF